MKTSFSIATRQENSNRRHNLSYFVMLYGYCIKKVEIIVVIIIVAYQISGI